MSNFISKSIIKFQELKMLNNIEEFNKTNVSSLNNSKEIKIGKQKN